MTQLPNYRFFDRTGGGVTHDIYVEPVRLCYGFARANTSDEPAWFSTEEEALEFANGCGWTTGEDQHPLTLDDVETHPDGGEIDDDATLAAAIAAGRAWIEAGDWERDEMERPLECCVREIVRRPNLSSLELPGVYDVRLEDYVILAEVDAASMDTVRQCLAGTARVMRLSDPDDEGCVRVSFGVDHIPMDIDEDATVDGDAHDCSGVCPAKDAPECAEGCEHEWEAPYELVGGCRENPGVWGSGHGSIKIEEVCAHCGICRTTDHGATLPSNGQQATRVSYEPADAKSLAWAMPDEVEVNGVTVALDWSDMTASHTVQTSDLRNGTADGPSDGEEIELPSGKSIELGSHNYSTDQPGNEDDEECTCTASFKRCD